MGQDHTDHKVEPQDDIDGRMEVPAHHNSAQGSDPTREDMGVPADAVDTPVYHNALFLGVFPHGAVAEGKDHVPEADDTNSHPECRIDPEGDEPQQYAPQDEFCKIDYGPQRAGTCTTHPLCIDDLIENHGEDEIYNGHIEEPEIPRRILH